jgi:hypothetical protein
MKKFFFFLMLACATSAYAQQPIFLGLRGGINLGNLDVALPNIPSPDIRSKTGVIVGVYGQFGLSNHFSIQPEITYWRQPIDLAGSQALANTVINGIPISSATYQVDAQMNLAYQEVLLSLRYQIGAEKLKLYFLGGPFIGLIQSANIDGKVEAIVNNIDLTRVYREEDIKDDFENLNYGLSFGGGIQYDLANGYLFLDGRLGLGMVNVVKASDSPFSEVKTGTAAITIGYAHRLR